jgi:hypothetical protein
MSLCATGHGRPVIFLNFHPPALSDPCGATHICVPKKKTGPKSVICRSLPCQDAPRNFVHNLAMSVLTLYFEVDYVFPCDSRCHMFENFRPRNIMSHRDGRLGTRPPSSPEAPRRSSGFAIPPFLHVFLMFMTQFVVLIFLTIPVMSLYERGVNSVLLAIGTIATLVGTLLLIAFVGRVVPARCKYCRFPSHYRGLGWWPFIYHYDCKHCGQRMRFEVHG